MSETAKERWERAQTVANKAYQEMQAELNPPIGPETEVWVSHNLLLTKKMTLKNLALQLKIPLSRLIDPGTSIKYASIAVEQNAYLIDPIPILDGGENEWDVEEDGWSVTEIR
jgi:hypothetical protein